MAFEQFVAELSEPAPPRQTHEDDLLKASDRELADLIQQGSQEPRIALV